jgi:PAS domain S-box-containing protein
MIAAAHLSSEPSAAGGATLSEADRLAALARYQILDTPQEPAFDRIVRLAALLLDVPITLISLVDADRQWFKARYGLDVPETPRAIAFCDHAIRGSDILVVPDAELDPRFCDNPLVTGEMHVRFYAGAPLVTPDGFALGTICAIDRSPRDLNQRDAAILAALAEQIIHELEVRSALGELYREVAEGRRTARTLQGEGAKLAALLNATDNAVVTTDTDGQVASLNRVAEAMFGFEPGESVGWPMSRLISTEPGGEALTGSRDGHGRRKNGVEFPIEVSRASWTDAQGGTASGAILRDMTERRRAEAERGRQEAAEQTRDKLAALGRVAGGVAHELNNLLQPIIGLTRLELDSLPSDGSAEQTESRESLATIMECGNQARDVVRKVLMFARKAKPELVPTDFPAAVRRTIALFGKLLPPGVRVDEVIEGGAVGVATINEAELAEVMANLAVNSACAMDGSGTLTIHVDRLELTEAASTLGVAGGRYFRIAVADTGHGMDAATRAQIFEPFFTTKPIGEGTGLGLSMVYGVLRDWKGAVAVDSSLGVGSTFSLYVPVTETT